MLTYHEIMLRLLFAAAMGIAIGAERDIHRRPAGVRTSMFVCIATALFTILSGELAHQWGDTSSTRIASNIVQGIGFLGAGAILRDSASVIGMTTAATIFVEAAIGMAAGGGLYAVASSATGLVLFALIVLWWLTDRFGLRGRVMMFRLTSSSPTEGIASDVQRSLAAMKIPMQQFRATMSGAKSIVEFEADVSHHQQETVVQQFKREGITIEVVPVESHHA